MKNSKKVLLFLIMIISIFGITNVKALGKDIKVTDVTIKEKSGTISVVEPVITNNEIPSNITFNKVDDFVTFELEIKNNEEEKYRIESIKDNNTNNNIKIDYTFSKDYISKGETSKVTLKLTYKNKLVNIEKININDLRITLNLETEDGNSEEIIINPVTGDNIFHYLVLLIIALTGIVLLVLKKNLFKIKIGRLLIVLAVVLLPFTAFAKEKYELNIKFKDVVVKGEFETYNISIDKGDGSKVEIRQIQYGEALGDLGSNPIKEGYTFDKYVDNEGNEVTKDTIITKEIDVIAKYNAIEYTITYNLDGGSASNPSKYTIEDEITLNNPTKEGYTFSGWTGTGIDAQTASVTITEGSTGDRTYTANYSANEDTEYKVIHKYEKLNGDYEIEEVTEYGETNKEVEAPIKSKTGFVNPSVQRVTIASDGSASVTYTYLREEYEFSITDRTYIDSTSTEDGTYPYETPITIKAVEREGYDFSWSDGETALERTFDLTGETSLTPVYTANTNTAYKVEHYKMKLDGETYELADTQNLTGTTDSPITPSVNTYEGFTSPEVQNTTINGDGSTVVKYYYRRNKQTITITNPENIVEGDISGEYYYEEEITLTAKTIDGKTFVKWSNDETDNPITITVGTEDIEIGPIYTGNQLTVSFDTDGGSEVASQTVNYGEKAIRPENNPTKTNYVFDNWYRDNNYNTLFDFDNTTITTDITIYGKFNEITEYTVTFNSNGGGNVNSITVAAGETIQSFTTPTAPSGKIFDGWYTGESDGTKITAPYTPEGDITLYAHWSDDLMPIVFSEPGECTFNGSSGVLTGEDCSYANGTNKYIDTGINLYNSTNHDKDYEIGFTIVSYNSSEQVKQATFMNTKLEGNNYPGLVFRRKDLESGYDLSSRNTSSANARALFKSGTIQKFKVYRITNTETGVQEIFYSINDEEKIKINDLSQFNPEFDLSVWFGAAPTNASATAAQRILVNTTLSNMYIKLGTYQEDTNKYKVTYNANGGSVSPSSKTINIGEQIGTLPTPTAPAGKTFTSWYTGLTDGVEVTSSYIPNNNITIYARYYTDITGATVSPSSISILNGASETLTVSNIEEEYTFSSNDTSITTVDQTGKVTGTGVGTTTITITGTSSGKTRTINVTVEPSSYTVTLNANGGSVNPTSITVNIGDAIGTLPTPTAPTGKSFDGWYTELTGGIEVTSSYVPNTDIEIYARYTDNPCKTFSTDSWSTIKDNLENDSSYYAVGCEKEVELDMDDDGTNESYTVRLANTSTPEVCSTEGYSQTACGTVIEFVDIVTSRQMNSSSTNEGGWKATEMVTYLNSDFYNRLPSSLQLVIIPTYPIVSSSGKNHSSANITSGDFSINKLYLLSTRELGEDSSNDNKNDVTTDTRTLDYYLGTSSSENEIKRLKKELNGSENHWWLRTSPSNWDNSFKAIFYDDGTRYGHYGRSGNFGANGNTLGVAPAFRIGTMPEFTVSFDKDGGSTVADQTVSYGSTATRPTTDPTKTGFTFDNWYTDDTYQTVFDFDNTVITSDTTIYAHFEELKVCADNENITNLSSTTCSNNENITVGDGIVCKRALKLHEETCSRTSTSTYCSGAGYTTSGSKGTNTITYGNCGTSGTLSSGDAFTCDVNGDGKYNEITERFYYISDYYNTSTKEFENVTAVLIYYNNVTNGVSCNKNTYAYSSLEDIQAEDSSRTSCDNWHGPLTIMKQLPTTGQWSNVSLKNTNRAILAEFQSTHDSPTTRGGTLPTNFSYSGYASRLLTAKELMSGCNLTQVGRIGMNELRNCNYVMENTKYAKSTIGSEGTWLETPDESEKNLAWVISSFESNVNTNFGVYYTDSNGARPVIEVPKSKISY